MKTYQDITDYSYSDDEYNYQSDLTVKLDATQNKQPTQELINEIVLWKLNRYVYVDQETLDLLNSPNLQADTLDETFTKALLKKLLLTRGIRLPMASTILRFRNPRNYQIIDQRAYRFVSGQELKLDDPKLNEKEINAQIELYLQYLKKLKEVAKKTGWDFSNIDRILYLRDQEHNKDLNIKYT